MFFSNIAQRIFIKSILVKNTIIMNKFILFFTTFSLSIISAQTTRFVYEYESVPDSLEISETEKYTMFLDVNKKGSLFFDSRKYNLDSIKANINMFATPPPPIMMKLKPIDYRIEKSYPKYETAFIISDFNVKDDRKQVWKLEKETDKYLEMSVQKATTNFAGRTWVAWFTTEIPIPDGPYKFCGLPGLILKIEDSTSSHRFTLVGIKNNIPDYEYPAKNSGAQLNISLKDYKKIIQEYREDPVKDYRLDVLKNLDAEETAKAMQGIKEYEKILKEQVKKDNNIIEIDLLKVK
jgi:GLPGLI family protein